MLLDRLVQRWDIVPVLGNLLVDIPELAHLARQTLLLLRHDVAVVGQVELLLRLRSLVN